MDEIGDVVKGEVYAWEDQTGSLRATPTPETWEKATKNCVFNEEGVQILGCVEVLREMGRLGDLEAID